MSLWHKTAGDFRVRPRIPFTAAIDAAALAGVYARDRVHDAMLMREDVIFLDEQYAELEFKLSVKWHVNSQTEKLVMAAKGVFNKKLAAAHL